jgi:hypothetical protein
VKINPLTKQANVAQRWKCCAWYAFGLFQVLVFLAAAVKPAHAYVDPGSGLLFFQVGGSMLAGALFVLRAKIRKLLRLGKPEERAEQANNGVSGEAEAGPHA